MYICYRVMYTIYCKTDKVRWKNVQDQMYELTHEPTGFCTDLRLISVICCLPLTNEIYKYITLTSTFV